MENKMKESINHPEHYNKSGVEAIDVISAFCDVQSFALGNAIKYIMRAPYKDDAPFTEHLKKALWYIKYIHKYEFKTTCHKLTNFECIVLDKIVDKYKSGEKYEKYSGSILESLKDDFEYSIEVGSKKDTNENEDISIQFNFYSTCLLIENLLRQLENKEEPNESELWL
jgi:hypothetical protein